MKNYKSLLFSALILASISSAKAEEAKWIRQSAISPDGKTIAFSYKGDIYTVGSEGGEARQLTTNAAYDQLPVWSPDGQKIAFASDRDGSMSVYVVSKNGGVPVRLTSSPYSETPVAFKDNETLLYQSQMMPSAEDMQFPKGFRQVYQVGVNGKGKGNVPKMVSSMPMENISISKDGKTWLYNDMKGYEDALRKHHTSSITRDVWSYAPSEGKYTKLTTFNGEDRNPVWGEGGAFYYLTEENGTFNVAKREGSSTKILTNFKNHPVRGLSRADNGLMLFSWNGELYTLNEGQEAKKLTINVNADTQNKDVVRQILSSGVTDFSVSPDGKEVAFVVHGDVYVTSTEYSTTRQITDTPDQERSVDFAPDGKSVIYAGERKGLWQIYQTSIVDKDGTSMVYAKELKEKNITNTDQTSFQPQFSPNGEKVAYLENRTTLKVLDLKSGKAVTALDGKFNYSYSDGDQNFAWSPDSKWLLSQYIGIGGWNNPDIALVKADGTELHDLTNSGYSDTNAKWVLDGKAMIWSSDRAGYRSHGSWGAEEDYYIMFFDVEAYDKFCMNKEDLALLEQNKSKKEKKEEEKEEEKKEKKAEEGDNTPEKVKDLKFDLDNAEDRIIRLTKFSARLGDAVLDKEGKNLYVIANTDGDTWLYKVDMATKSYGALFAVPAGSEIKTDREMENMFLTISGVLNKYPFEGESYSALTFEALFNYRAAEERAYIFDHCWRQVNEKFYDKKIHGIDWNMYRENYEQFLPYINNNYDFADLLSEMLGELNGSHTGSGYRVGSKGLTVGRLGLFYDDSYEGEGVKIKEIMAKSPLKLKKTDVEVGMIITKINGVKISSEQESTTMDYLLAGKVGKNITLTVAKKEGGKEFDVEMKPISSAAEATLLYHRWVERNRKIVEEKSEGKLGYIHIKGMDSESFRVLYSELLGKYRNKEAVIIDTRHNGGGWLHDDVVTLLGAKEYTRYMPREQYIGSDPYNKYTKKSCMLVCEDNYSNAHGTPWLYKELGIGKLIGAPVPGTMTAVWWETQIDSTLYFGIPQVGAMDNRGEYLENHELQPDILIYNDPADVLKGKDAQLEGAIEEMLKEIKK